MSDSYVPPAVLAMLAAFGLACALAALPVFRLPLSSRARPFPPLAPHPSQPSSMLSFVALPSFLLLLTLARFGFLFVPDESLNSPDRRRIVRPPGDVKLDYEEDRQQLVCPRNTAALTVAAARRDASTEQLEAMTTRQ